MKLAFVTCSATLVATFYGSFAQPWEVSEECTRRRELELEGRVFDVQPDHKSYVDEESRRPDTADLQSSKNIRGDKSTFHRQLQDVGFQMRMYWERGFCWQEEIREQKWCLECHNAICWDGGSLVIQECSDNMAQKFIWVSIDGTGGGKIKPKTRPDLCWEQWPKGDYKYQLKQCDSSNKNTQIVTGWKWSGRFELLPYGQTRWCFSQQHHPKAWEEIYGEVCATAREDHTNYWIVCNTSDSAADCLPPMPSPLSNSSPTPSPVSPSCRPYDLKLASNWKIQSGNPLQNSQDNISLEQWHTGNLVARDTSSGAILWQSGVSRELGEYYSILQSDADLITYQGTPSNFSELVWKTGSVHPSGKYFLGVACDRQAVSIYEGTAIMPGDAVWSG